MCFFFSIQTVAGSGYYGIEFPLRYMRNLKTRRLVPLVGCQQSLVVRMASNEATTTGGKLDKYIIPYLLTKVTKITLAFSFVAKSLFKSYW